MFPLSQLEKRGPKKAGDKSEKDDRVLKSLRNQSFPKSNFRGCHDKAQAGREQHPRPYTVLKRDALKCEQQTRNHFYHNRQHQKLQGKGELPRAEDVGQVELDANVDEKNGDEKTETDSRELALQLPLLSEHKGEHATTQKSSQRRFQVHKF